MNNKEWAKMPKALKKYAVGMQFTPLQAIGMVGFDNEKERKLIKVMTMPYFLLDDAQRRYKDFLQKRNLKQEEKRKAKLIDRLFNRVTREVAKTLNLDEIVTLYDWADEAQTFYKNEILLLDMTTRNLYANFADVEIRDKVCDLLVIEVCVRIAKSFIEAHIGFKADESIISVWNALRDFTDYVGNKENKKIAYSKAFFESYEQSVNNLINKFVSFLDNGQFNTEENE